MNLLFNLPEELERYIYQFDSTYHEEYGKVIKEFEKKLDLTTSCGYTFEKGSLNNYLQNNLKPKCNCYFCTST